MERPIYKHGSESAGENRGDAEFRVVKIEIYESGTTAAFSTRISRALSSVKNFQIV